MTNADTLHVEPTPLGWVAYFDPEGLNGHGKTREEALTELLDQTDECWRRTMDERKEEARKAILRGEELNKWQDLAQKITGVDANDHGWLRAEVDRSFAKETTMRDEAQKAALYAQDECLKAQDVCLTAQAGQRDALDKRAAVEAYAGPRFHTAANARRLLAMRDAHCNEDWAELWNELYWLVSDNSSDIYNPWADLERLANQRQGADSPTGQAIEEADHVSRIAVGHVPGPQCEPDPTPSVQSAPATHADALTGSQHESLEEHRARINATPRTDALLLEINEGRTFDHYGPMVDLARALERELRDVLDACAPPKAHTYTPEEVQEKAVAARVEREQQHPDAEKMAAMIRSFGQSRLRYVEYNDGPDYMECPGCGNTQEGRGHRSTWKAAAELEHEPDCLWAFAQTLNAAPEEGR